MSDKIWKKNNKEDVVEEFCGACLAIPFAFAGIGAGALGGNSRKTYKNGKRIAFWGLVVTFISLLVMLYYYFSCSKCR